MCSMSLELRKRRKGAQVEEIIRFVVIKSEQGCVCHAICGGARCSVVATKCTPRGQMYLGRTEDVKEDKTRMSAQMTCTEGNDKTPC
jgi:hypothetical protein